MSDHPILTIPTDVADADDFEDLVSALFAANGWHVAQNVQHTAENRELLEVDLLATRWHGAGARRVLVESKSGRNWKFLDVFKLLGHKTFLDLDEAMLAAAHLSGKDDAGIQESFRRHGCEIMGLGSREGLARQNFAVWDAGRVPDAGDVAFWRRVFQLRRRLVAGLHSTGFPPEVNVVIDAMKHQKQLIEDAVFQHPTAFERIAALGQMHLDYRNLAQRIANTLDSNSKNAAGHLACALRGNGHRLVYLGMFLDTRARMATATATIDYLLSEHDVCSAEQNIMRFLRLSNSTAQAITELQGRDELQLYPLIWQSLVYELGGFLMTDRLDTEVARVKASTGAKTSTIHEALDLWDLLFPVQGGWWKDIGANNLSVLMMVPAPVQGLGALRRDRIYQCHRDDDLSYFTSISDQRTANFLKRVNNICYHRMEGNDCPRSDLGPAAPFTAVG